MAEFVEFPGAIIVAKYGDIREMAIQIDPPPSDIAAWQVWRETMTKRLSAFMDHAFNEGANPWTEGV